jgi:Mg2+/citrate symporter
MGESWPWVVAAIGIVLLLGISRLGWLTYLPLGGSGGTLAASINVDVSKWMAPLISLIVLAAALFVILSGRYGDAEAKWAFGVVGTILGYWLKK